MNSSLNIVELRDGRINASPPVREAGIRADLTDTSFELSLAGLQSSPVYYRVGMGRLEWSCDLAAFDAGDGIPVPDAGTLLTIADGYQVAPDYSPIPGVARLPLGAVVQVDGAGVTVSRRQPTLPQHLTFQQAVTEALVHLGDDFAIAYSGGCPRPSSPAARPTLAPSPHCFTELSATTGKGLFRAESTDSI